MRLTLAQRSTVLPGSAHWRAKVEAGLTACCWRLERVGALAAVHLQAAAAHIAVAGVLPRQVSATLQH